MIGDKSFRTPIRIKIRMGDDDLAAGNISREQAAAGDSVKVSSTRRQLSLHELVAWSSAQQQNEDASKATSNRWQNLKGIDHMWELEKHTVASRRRFSQQRCFVFLRDDAPKGSTRYTLAKRLESAF